MKGRLILAGFATAATSAAVVATPALAQGSGTQKVPQLGQLRVLNDAPVHANLSAQSVSAALSASSTTIKMFSASVNDGGTTFTYKMVGKTPFKQQTNPAATIKTLLVPLIIKLPNNDTFDPTAGDACDSTSALSRVQNSPIFKSQSWTWGSTSIGTAQYGDAFRRSEFWKYTGPTGINPGYHVKLSLVNHAAITVNVPIADAAEGNTVCGKLGAMEINWFDNYVQTTLFPQLVSQGYGANYFPLFLVGNVVEYITTTNNCCVLGYHNAFNNSSLAGSPIQTYGVSMFDNTGDFSGSHDISALSHEVGEWLDDPLTNNPTKPWGHIGQVSGCQSNLEVGDPLSGTTLTDTVGGYAYHPQELAFFSWFYHQSPSVGVNGWYSNQGTFTTPAAACS